MVLSQVFMALTASASACCGVDASPETATLTPRLPLKAKTACSVVDWPLASVTTDLLPHAVSEPGMLTAKDVFTEVAFCPPTLTSKEEHSLTPRSARVLSLLRFEASLTWTKPAISDALAEEMAIDTL